MSLEKSREIGIILSNSSSSSADFQIIEDFENGIDIHEGKLVIIKSKHQKILARIASIRPFNSFYNSGDLWSSVRRAKQPLPLNIATEYEVASLDLLMRIDEKKDIRFPPKPGDKVLTINPEENLEEIFKIKRNDAGFIWYGSLSGYKNVPLPLTIENIPMHMAVFGVTGSGKSYDTGALIEKLANIPAASDDSKYVSYPMLIIDANGDYSDYYEKFNNKNLPPSKRGVGIVGNIKKFVFEKSPSLLDKTQTGIEKIGIDLDSLDPRDLSKLIITYYKNQVDDSSALSISLLERIFSDLIEDGESITNFFSSVEKFNELRRYLNTRGRETDVEATVQTIRAAKRALNRFYELERIYELFSSKSELKDIKFVDNLVNNRSIYIIDFSADGAPGVSIEAKQFVMGYLAAQLYKRFTDYKINPKEHTRYCIFLIEEAQNFCPGKSYPIGSSMAHNVLSKIATQGRKFGLSLCLVSQRPSFLDRIIVSMCNTFFIHRISPEDISFVKSVTGGLPESLERKLTNLHKGEVIVTGQMTTVPFAFLIKIHGRTVPHTAGETKVLESLIHSNLEE